MNHRLLHFLFLMALPVIVAAYGLSVLTAVLLVLAALLWGLLITLSGLMFPRKGPELVLETISASHFVEKVRWCMDRLGLEYIEHRTAGVMGVFFRGRTVPRLKVRTGLVVSTLGESPSILRYLWGRYSAELGSRARFLEPTQQRLEWEQKIDAYGACLQVWVYWHLLPHRELTLHAWGRNSARVPLYQRWLLVVMYPVLAAFIRKAFRLSRKHYERVAGKIEALLADVESRIEDGDRSILSGDGPDFVDISFAAMTGLWLQPKGFAAGTSDDVMLSRDRLPPAMRADVERWIADFPKTERFVQKLFREERRAASMS
jgi:glutathione S-transferase